MGLQMAAEGLFNQSIKVLGSPFLNELLRLANEVRCNVCLDCGFHALKLLCTCCRIKPPAVDPCPGSRLPAMMAELTLEGTLQPVQGT